MTQKTKSWRVLVAVARAGDRVMDRCTYRDTLWFDPRDYRGEWSRFPRYQVQSAVLLGAARAFRMSRDEMLGESRQSRMVVARQAAAFLLVRVLGMSLCSVGRRLNRDHTTIIHAVRKLDGPWPQEAVDVMSNVVAHVAEILSTVPSSGLVVPAPPAAPDLSRAAISRLARAAINDLRRMGVDRTESRPLRAAAVFARHALIQLEEVARAHDV